MTYFLGQILNPRMTFFFGTEGVYFYSAPQENYLIINAFELISDPLMNYGYFYGNDTEKRSW